MIRRFWAPLAFAAVAVSASAQTTPQYVPGELLVKFRPGFSSSLAHQAVLSRVVNEIPEIGWQKVRLRAGMTVPQALRYYRSLSSVESVTPNLIRQISAMPTDPRTGEVWSINRTNLPQAWDLTVGASNVRVAVIDTGVEHTHEDLAGRVTLGTDWVNNDPIPNDENGHGTHVAGTIAAVTNNGRGIPGVMWNAEIIAIKTFEQRSGTLEDIVEGIREAGNLRADVVNMSFGGPGATDIERDAVAFAVSRGCVMIAAAGNENTSTPSYPAAFPNVVAVAATDQNDQRASFSNFGASWVDVAAPGVAILSTDIRNTYSYKDGTSMASPFVAGLAGLIIARAGKGNISPARVVELIEGNTVNVGNFVRTGRVDAFRAVNAAAPPVVTTMAPTLFDTSWGSYSGNGTTFDVTGVDASHYLITSRVTPNGNVTQARAEFTFTPSVSTLQRLRMSMRAQGPNGTSGVIWLRDWRVADENAANAWVLARTFGIGTNLSTSTFDLPAPLPRFIQSGTGRVSMRFRSILPTRLSTAPYTLRVDMLSLEATNRSAVQP